MNKILVIIALFVLASCSSVEVNTAGREKFYVASFSGSDTVIEKEVNVDFYFWGLVPERQEVVLSDEFKNLGVSNPSFFVIEQKNTLKNLLLTIVTLGLYSPVSMKLSLLSNGEVK